jgi:hypothetical protein
MSRRSSQRQLKIPAKLDDSIHDLNKKVDYKNMKKGSNKGCLGKDIGVVNSGASGDCDILKIS